MRVRVRGKVRVRVRVKLCSRSTRGMASASVAVVSAASKAGTSSDALSICAVSPSCRLAAVRMRTLSAARRLSEPGLGLG